MKTLLIIIAIVALVAIAIPFINQIDFQEHACPFCYGKDFCNNKNVTLRLSSISDIINNLLSVKNVYKTTNGVVLKKLGHSEDLINLAQHICLSHGKQIDCEGNKLDVKALDYEHLLNTALRRVDKGYKICGEQSIEIVSKRLLQTLEQREELIYLWTISLINFEPLFYKLFQKQIRSLPIYHGACGRVIAVENCGKTLSDFSHADWITRATIARGIIDMAVIFTAGDRDFHIYLTDVSPDNIVVDEVTLEAKFVDFGNVILVQKSNASVIHNSRYYADLEGFAYSESDICESSISDHNFYSVCTLLLSDKAPWPMMNGGLLHSIPDGMQRRATRVSRLIESCVQPTDKLDRFQSIAKLDDVLKDILSDYL